MINAICQEIRRRSKWLVTSHLNPDGDAVGSLVGLGLLLKDLGKDVLLYNFDGVPDLYRFLPGADLVKKELRRFDFEGAIVLDSGDAERVGPLSQQILEIPLVINIDHHLFEEPWGDLRWIDVSAAAVGEMLHRLAGLIPISISPEAALNFYTALMTDTLSFRHSNTTPRSLTVASELVELGADPALAARKVYSYGAPGRIRLLARVLDTLELAAEGRIGFLYVDQADFEATGTTPADLDGFVEYARGVEGVAVAALVRQEKEGHKLSLRSTGLVDVARLAAGFGGGGHRLAAGFFVPGGQEEAKRAVIEAAEKALTEAGSYD